MLICRVLGPFEVSSAEGALEIGGPHPRRLLQALVIGQGRPVTEDRLAEAIWGDHPPRNQAASLQAYVSRLRKALGTEAITRRPGGYLLTAHSDVAEFEARLARSAYESALDLWRGQPYPDLEEYADQERHRLNEQYATAVEERAAALLAAGDGPGAVTALRPAVQAEPYRERGWELLIVGLYRSARQAEALAALREVRTRLAEDLGVDPGPGLQSLERRLLAQDPTLLLRAPASRPLTRFVGRHTELALMAAALRESRLVTLVGPGGAGKTRLAVEWISEATVPLARLADVHSPLDLPSALAESLGLPETPSRFTGLDGLLVLDNCEHLTAAVAALVITLLADNPGLTVMATSREPLGVDGERLLLIDPLPRADAVRLLTDRITLVRPGWRPDPADAAHLDRLADALDGIPLALELAAARARVLNLEELTGMLGERFPALGPVPRGALAPHTTLEATVAWSVDLLSASERARLLRLWPFEGGFTLEAAEAVGCDLTTLSALVTRSVVTADTTVSPARYRLLEIIRAYCRDHDPQPSQSRAAHAAWARELVARTVPDLRGPRSGRSNRLLTRELANLRVALAHDLVADPAAALRTAGLLEWFWLRGGHMQEGLRLMDQALAAAPEAGAEDRARALGSTAALLWLAGDLAQVELRVQSALKALGTPQDEDEGRLLAQLRYYEATLCLVLEDYEQAARLARTAIAMARRTGEAWFGAVPDLILGAALVGLGETAQGRDLLYEALGRTRAHGYGWARGFGSQLLARTLVLEQPVVALEPLHEAVEWFREEGDFGQFLVCLLYGAIAIFELGDHRRAAILHTAAHRHADRRGIRLYNADPQRVSALDGRIAGLDHDLREQARAVADGLDEDEAAALIPVGWADQRSADPDALVEGDR